MTQLATMDKNYSERLAAAMKRAECSTSKLSQEIGISYQAVKKVLDGKSNALTAENNAKTARYLNISSHWLATGEGDMLHANTSSKVHFSFGVDETSQAEASTLALLSHIDKTLATLTPTLQSAGRDILKKWAAGEVVSSEAANILDTLQKINITMAGK